MSKQTTTQSIHALVCAGRVSGPQRIDQSVDSAEEDAQGEQHLPGPSLATTDHDSQQFWMDMFRVTGSSRGRTIFDHSKPCSCLCAMAPEQQDRGFLTCSLKHLVLGAASEASIKRMEVVSAENSHASSQACHGHFPPKQAPNKPGRAEASTRFWKYLGVGMQM